MDELRYYSLDGIGGYGKAYACTAACGGEDGGVDADQPAGGVQERTTAVACAEVHMMAPWTEEGIDVSYSSRGSQSSDPHSRAWPT